MHQNVSSVRASARRKMYKKDTTQLVKKVSETNQFVGKTSFLNFR